MGSHRQRTLASSSHTRRLRVSLLSLLGLVPVACGNTTTDEPEPRPSAPTYVGVDTDGRVLCTQTVQDPSGLVSCQEGYTHRLAAGSCAPLPGPAGTAPPPVCATDSDCLTGQACLCGPYGGTCYDATCRTDEDCQLAEVCSPVYAPPLPCQMFVAYAGLACERPEVPGTGGASGTTPVPTGGGTCGRPFLVQGVPRVALCSSSASWTQGQARPELSQLSGTERAALAAHWSAMGQMEHASIAAFARFALQLLSLGAPPQLLEDCTRALADETAHARLCFEFASAYAGQAIGPGPLDVAGSLELTTLGDIVDLVIIEGCFGECRAALEALEAAALATDPVVAAAYARIAEDEQRHAELAFRFVHWALERDPQLVRDRLRATLVCPPTHDACAEEVVIPVLYGLLKNRTSPKSRNETSLLQDADVVLDARQGHVELLG